MMGLEAGAVMTHLEDNGYGLLSIPWPLGRPHFVHNTTNTPDVKLEVAPFIWANHLRRHPKDRPLCRSVCFININVTRPLRESEIRYLALSQLFNKNTIRF